MKRTFEVARSALLIAGVLAFAGCAVQEKSTETAPPEIVPSQITRLLPSYVSDRAGWAADIYAAFSTLGISPSVQNLCSVIAITEQESSFQADPAVAGLPEIAWREIDGRAERAGIPAFAVHTALQITSADGRSFAARIDAVRTERELSEIFEDFIALVPLGARLFAKLNPVRTGGPMQVGISFAESHAARRRYPYPVNGSIRREVFTRRGGVYFGTAHLLGYDAPYAEPIYRFADFNAGWFASRNAAFQSAVSRLSGMPVTLDGDLLPPGASADRPPGETESAVLQLSSRLGLSAAAIRSDLERGEDAAFERTRLYRRVFEQVDRLDSQRAPRAVLPTIALKSPKFKSKLTTAWFARRVDQRFQRCLAKASSAA